MRLIDGDKLYSTLYEIRMDEVAKYGRNDAKHCCSLSTALYEIQNAPTIDPVKRGRWVKLDMHPHLADHKCTACGESSYVPTCMGEPLYNFCPNCGAKMDEVTKEETDE